MPTHQRGDLATGRDDISADDIVPFGLSMWDREFVFSVQRETLPQLNAPLLVLPGNDMAHPTGVGLEIARLLPNAELLEQWKEPAEIVPRTVELVRSFVQTHASQLEPA